MRRLFLLPVVVLALAMLLAPTVAATTGQPPEMVGQTSYNAFWTPANTIAQTFTTPNKTERLDYVDFFVYSSTDGGTIESWIKAGLPGTSGIAGTDVTAAVPAGASGVHIKLVPPTGITLGANAQYSIMFSVQGSPNDTKIAELCTSSGYSGGAAYVYDGANWTTPSTSGTPCAQDLTFQVLMSPLPGTLDQQQNLHNHSVGYVVMAQTFTAGAGGTLTAVSLWSEGSKGGEVTVEICSVSEGIDCLTPALVAGIRPALATGVLSSTTLTVGNSNPQWIDFAFSPPPVLVASTQYAIVIDGNDGWSGSITNAYTGGSASNGSGGGWSSINGDPIYDLAFQTFITPAAVASTAPGAPTAPPTSTAGAPSAPGGSAPLPLFLALMAAIPVAGLLLVKRRGAIARQ